MREADNEWERESPRGSGRGGERGGDRSPRERRARAPKRALGDVDVIVPGRITALHERRAGSGRYVVEIDGRVAATISVEEIAELGLRVGCVVEDATAERVREAASRLEVFDKALALLAVRARSSRDLQLRLRRAGAPASATAAAIERLTRLGYVDDEAYARTVARSRALSGGISKRRIGQELQRQGVSREIVNEAVEETVADVGLDEGEAALRIARKRIRSMGALDPRKQRQRLYAFLARRGYAPDIVARVVAAVQNEERDESPDDFA